MNNRATIKDVAKHAGVALSTASVVLSRKSSVKVAARTAERVLAAARRLDYVPDIRARGLRLKRSFQIGVLLASIEHNLIPEILAGVEDILARQNYITLLATFQQSTDFEEKCRRLTANGVDGVLAFCNASPNYRRGLAHIVTSGIPLLFMGRQESLEFRHLPFVCIDGFRMGFLAAEYLLKLGHHKIVFYDLFPDRLDGFLAAFRKAGIAYDEKLVFSSFNEQSLVYALERGATAVVAPNDNSAAAVIAFMNKRGLNVPGQISVIGANNVKIAELTWPPLTTVSQKITEVGKTAATRLLEYIDGAETGPVTLEPELIIRESCHAVAGTERSF